MPSEEQNIAVIHKLFDGLSKGNLAVIDECIAENFVRHSPGYEDMGIEDYRQVRKQTIAALPSVTTIEEIVASGDKVAFRVKHKAIHTGTLMGRPPTGNKIDVDEVYFARFENGKIAEWWCLLDRLTMQQQLKPTEEIGK